MPNVRFRYSLLTLLVLTALVAGGVKLWHGPHRVAEPEGLNWKKVYSYTLDWRGNRIVDGPVVWRKYAEQKLVFFNVGYIRLGTEINWHYMSSRSGHEVYSEANDSACPLSEGELLAFRQVRDAEIQRLAAAGKSPEKPHEGVLRFTPF